ncbi:YcaO-like family protein [Serinicoccus kebangsaanensis]|uniref:YcaO-like family protein n=1 Tax=Serinicoccus kebangsaanensis TaxID=2602069 RepID=UPI00124CB0F6|nr:YcaO-like family protein [Serinicoccus kebangsaanensis]
MTFTSWRRTTGEFTLPGRPFLWGGRAERELSGDQAWRRVHTDLEHLGWSSSARWSERTGPTTAQCILREGEDEIGLGVGAGKGRLDVAIVGAHFEAVEHAVTGPSWAPRLPVAPVDRSDPRLVDAWQGEEWLDDLRTTSPLSSVWATGLGTTQAFPAPLFRSAPWMLDDTPEVAALRLRTGDDTDYGPVAAYSTNSGSAIGATAEEAVLHGLNESVERDALSLFLLLHVLAGRPAPPRIEIAPSDEDLTSCRAAAEQTVGQPITLLDITTDLGVPCVLALAGTGSPRPLYGSGASIGLRVAVERALTEVVQGFLLRQAVDHPGTSDDAGPGVGPGPAYLRLSEEQATQHRQVEDRFAGHPALLRCATLRLGDLPPPEGISHVPPTAATASVTEQVRAVVRRLEEAGHRVGWVPLHTWPSGTTVAQVHVPGLELFHQVLVGHAPRPGARARRRREAAAV